ncbi:MAG: 4a-hydroxytetrahydrobiopterin dehydratase [Planctomycetales bacterium]|nr:4a-hydroxytetrahydrobiopterin dehydratase [Planctomycetales bacterium]
MSDSQLLDEQQLQRALENLGEWELRDGWLSRTYVTPGWPHTMQLVQAIGFLAEAAWHHPDLRVGYAKVTVLLQTHRVGGITQMDVELAGRIESLALWQPTDESALDGFPKQWVR